MSVNARRDADRRERGALLMLTAILLPVLVLMTSFVVDLGIQRASRRTMQARADVIALDMVRIIAGRTANAVRSDPATETAIQASATRNGIARAKVVSVDWGVVDSTNHFFSGTTNPASAVKVTTSETTQRIFHTGTGSTTRSAVATTGEPVAGFSIGSFGANLSTANSGLLNQILTPLLGSPAGVSALSYQGLAGANIKVGDLATELGLLTPGSALTTNVGTEQFLLAAANVLQRNGDTANANLLRGMITPQVKAFGPISIGKVVGAQTGTEDAALASNVNVLDLLTATAFASKCPSPPTDVSSCTGLSVPSLGITGLPLVSSSGSVKVIEGVATAYGHVGASADTNQTEVHLQTALSSQQVGQCVPSGFLDLHCVLGGLLVNFVDATVSVDATVKLADAHGSIAAITCGTPQGLDVSTRTGLYTVTGTVTITFGRRGILGGVLGSTLGTMTLGFNTSNTNVFDTSSFHVPPDVLGVTTDQTGMGNIGLSGATLATTGGTGILGTLGTLGITNTVGPLLNTLVNPLLGQLDAKVLGPFSDILGLNVSGSDVKPLLIGCDGQGLRLVG